MSVDPGSAPGVERPAVRRVRLAGFGLGPVLAFGAYLAIGDAMTPAGRGTAAVATLMAVWWLTEALHLTVVALVPIVLFPLVGALGVREATAPYGHELIFLFMGGFLLALSMERWGLHRRMALWTLRLVGPRPRTVVLGFMALAACLSMWVSNTATAVMLMPVAMSVIQLALRREPGGPIDAGEHGGHFALCLLLGIAYAASAGGLGTIIGSPPNVLVVSYARDALGVRIRFLDWMLFGVPLVVVLVLTTWVLLTRVLYPVRLATLPGVRRLARRELDELGPTGPPFRRGRDRLS